ncbi:hypothetical protein [Bacillus mobilis]
MAPEPQRKDSAVTHITRRELSLPPRLYASGIAITDTGVHIELASGLHIATLHMSGEAPELLADLDTLQAALEDARRQLEQRAAWAEYDVPAPRPQVEFVIGADWSRGVAS